MVTDALEPHVSLREAAEFLGVSPKTLYHRLERGDAEIHRLRPARVFGRWRFPVKGIEEAYARGRQEAQGLQRARRGVLG